MAWFHIPGHHQDTVISTRVRLSRNLAEYPFPARLDAPRAKEVAGKVEGVLEKNGFSKIDFADISRTSAQSLVEKQYADPAALRESLPHALFLNEPCSLSVMVCEEDHVRLQSIRAGLALGDAFEGASKMEAQLDAELPFAFDKHLGYLTGNPAELGTAMRVSVLLCLPLLTAGQRMESFALQMGQLGLLLRCVYEDGALYGLSNRVTLGFTEEELLARVGLAADMLIRAEEKLRGGISDGESHRVTDRVFRAEGILRHAHRLTAGELLGYLTDLRLGASLGLTDVRVEALTALLAEGMPATLTLSAEDPPKRELELDILRARVVKETLFGA